MSGKELAKLNRSIYGQPIGADEPGAKEPAGPVFRPDAADPLVWEADWDLSAPEDIVYRIAIKGGHGDLVRNDEPWRINVLSDNPPVVRIQSHNGAEVIRVGNETVSFNLSAVDDVRLTGARLVFRKPGQPPRARKSNCLRTRAAPGRARNCWRWRPGREALGYRRGACRGGGLQRLGRGGSGPLGCRVSRSAAAGIR